jgi:hypothetical protein
VILLDNILIRVSITYLLMLNSLIIFGKPLMNRYYIHEKFKGPLKLENACYHSVQNVLSSSLLSKNTNIKIYRATILPFVLRGC